MIYKKCKMLLFFPVIVFYNGYNQFVRKKGVNMPKINLIKPYSPEKINASIKKLDTKGIHILSLGQSPEGLVKVGLFNKYNQPMDKKATGSNFLDAVGNLFETISGKKINFRVSENTFKERKMPKFNVRG